ncbi:MAG TPA: carbohydrate ABC transporter permease, partial [Clostridiales bacterium]|nr:carbohydrate ABC transporter permease [Clostridiales bacterium]
MKSNRYSFRNAGLGDKLYLICVGFLCVFAFLITLYPFIYIVAVSFSGSQAVYKGEVFLWPVNPTIAGYEQVVNQPGLWQAYGNTLYYTVFGTLLNMIATTVAAYPLSRERFFARRFFNFMLAFSMYFSGGLIPTYVMITTLGMYNSRWVMLLPGLVSAYNVMICRSAFAAIPNEIMESAEIDGANDLHTFYLIAVRL